MSERERGGRERERARGGEKGEERVALFIKPPLKQELYSLNRIFLFCLLSILITTIQYLLLLILVQESNLFHHNNKIQQQNYHTEKIPERYKWVCHILIAVVKSACIGPV